MTVADSSSRITIPPKQWVDLYSLANLPVGTKILIQNTGRDEVSLSESELSPTSLIGHNNLLVNGFLISSDSPVGAWAYSRLGTKIQIEVRGVNGFKPYSSTDGSEKLFKTAYDELSVSNSTPVAQITAHYGILDDVLTANLGGTSTTANSNFIASTGVGANNVSAIISAREIQYRAGQGLRCEISAIFTNGTANSTQQAGLLNSESSLSFGYNGVEFGILHSRDGQQESQELTLTTGASGSENATINIDGVPYVVPLTAGTPSENAYEIATYLEANNPSYQFTSVGTVVYAVAQLPDFGGGSFTFSSATAAGAWVQIAAGTLSTETWVNQADWNGESIVIDPQKGNVYQVQMQYLGYGGIFFWIKNPLTSRFALVHTINYESTSVIPSVGNPIFRVGWACRNTGNTSDIQVKGASAGIFTEGMIKYDGRPRGLCRENLSVGTVLENVLTVRNRLTFNDEANRAEIIPLLLSLSTDSTKTAVFEIIINPIVTGALIFQRYNINSLMEFADDTVLITGGDVIACFDVSASGALLVDISKIIEDMLPGEQYCICAKVSSGSASEMDVALTWKEDL